MKLFFCCGDKIQSLVDYDPCRVQTPESLEDLLKAWICHYLGFFFLLAQEEIDESKKSGKIFSF